MLAQSEIKGEPEEEVPKKKRVKKPAKQPKKIARLNNRKQQPTASATVDDHNDDQQRRSEHTQFGSGRLRNGSSRFLRSFVNRAAKSFCVIRVRKRTIWSVSILNWKKRPKATGRVPNA